MTRLAHPIPEACDLLSLGRTKFYEEVKAGRLLIMKAGGKTLVPHSALEEYIEQRIAEAKAAA